MHAFVVSAHLVEARHCLGANFYGDGASPEDDQGLEAARAQVIDSYFRILWALDFLASCAREVQGGAHSVLRLAPSRRKRGVAWKEAWSSIRLHHNELYRLAGSFHYQVASHSNVSDRDFFASAVDSSIICDPELAGEAIVSNPGVGRVVTLVEFKQAGGTLIESNARTCSNFSRLGLRFEPQGAKDES